MTVIPMLYRKYFMDNGNERLHLFKNLRLEYNCEKVLYPGSFVHVTPSFFFPEVVYVDLDKRCSRFFSDDETMAFVTSNKTYHQKPVIRYHETSFDSVINEENEYFDLIISQYAGFISRYCTKHLKKKGILLANDSHGDATLAYASGDYELVGTVNEDKQIETKDLKQYFIFARQRAIDINKVLETMKGPKYSHSCNSYIFQKK